MPLSLNNIPIKYKLILSVYISLFAIIVASFSVVINQEINNQHNELIIEAKIFNKFFSQDFVSIVMFGDIDKAADVTSRLRDLNKVEGLTIYDTNRQAIFYYQHNNNPVLLKLPQEWQPQHKHINDSILLFDPINFRGGGYGYVLTQLSTKEINNALGAKIKQAAVILISLLFASFIFAWLIQQYFTNPIKSLVFALRKSANTLDYSARLSETRKDEIGDLFRGFNNLLDKIEEEKKALHDQQFAFDQHCIVGITDAKGVITYANELFVKISGYTRDELIGRNYRILKSSYHSDDFFEDMYKIINGGEVWYGNVCNKAKDGHEYWVATTIVPLMGENQKPLSFMAMQTDISVQISTEANLSRAQKMVNIGSWELDLISMELIWSRELYNIFEINSEKHSATYEIFIESIHPNDRDKVRKAYSESLTNQQPYDLEYTLLMKDGRIKNLKERCETLFDQLGNPLRSIGVVHDVTKSKHTEEALRRSQKMDAVGQLTGGIAHDFNNIMGIILGNVELLELQGVTDESILKRLKPIKISAQRAAKLTKQLLSFSRRKAQQLITTNINSQLVNMKSLIEHSITPEIEVSYQLSEDLWLVKIDPGDFQDTILNIVINARDAMNHSGQLSIETSNRYLDGMYCTQNPDVKKGDYVEIIISDNGIGISAEHLSRIYEPFYTTKVEGSGTGLGLSMVFGFIERSKGYIKVNSEVDIGTTFKIYLPRDEDQKIIEKNAGIANDEMLPKGVETILVVDDEEELCELAKDSLQLLGYKVLTAFDGKQALKILESNSDIDLVFTDVVMPGGLNGYELANIVENKYSQIKILLTSGYTKKAVVNNGKDKFNAARFENNILSKPYTRQNLTNKIRQTLDYS